jgi:hypothetical protein
MDNLHLIHIIIIVASLTLYVICYFFFTIFLHKKYFNSILYSSIGTFLFLIILLTIFAKVNFLYLSTLLTYLCLLYTFSVALYTPKSSIRVKVLSIFYNRKSGLAKTKFLLMYNDKIIFKKRMARLVKSKTINYYKGYYSITNNKALTIHYINYFLKKIIS